MLNSALVDPVLCALLLDNELFVDLSSASIFCGRYAHSGRQISPQFRTSDCHQFEKQTIVDVSVRCHP